jgi:hypothetical protein
VFVYTKATGAIYTIIPTPADPQAYVVAGVPDGTYQIGAMLDLYGDGSQNLSTDLGDAGPTVTVSGSSVVAPALSIFSGNAFASVTTEHHVGGGSTDEYDVSVKVTRSLKQPVLATLCSGPHATTPSDLGINGNDQNGSLEAYWNQGATLPVVGDTYTLQVSYSDGTVEILSPAVTGVLAGVPTLIAPVGTSGLLPTFSWSLPNGLPTSYVEEIQVFPSMANGWIWDAYGLPMNQTSILYNADSSAAQSALTAGTTYSWHLSIQDSAGNRASAETSFTALAAP